MEEDKQEAYDLTTLYIPVNVRRRYELVDGIGRKEIALIVTWTIIGLIIGLIVFFLRGYDPFPLVISPIVTGCATAVFTRKDKTNRSTIDLLVEDYKYSVSQKRYDYKYYNIYEKGGKINVKSNNRDDIRDKEK